MPDNVVSLPLVGKNKGHPAVFPVELPAFFIRLLAPPGGLVVDPFAGSGTTGVAAYREGRSCVLIDNNRAYCRQAQARLLNECGLTVSLGARSAGAGKSAGEIVSWPVMRDPAALRQIAA